MKSTNRILVLFLTIFAFVSVNSLSAIQVNAAATQVKKASVQVSVASTGNKTVEIKYDKKITILKASFQIKEKYGSKSPIKIKGITQNAGKTSVLLTTDPQKASTIYELTIQGVQSSGKTIQKAVYVFTGKGPALPPVCAIKSMVVHYTEDNMNKLILEFNTGLDPNTAGNVSNYHFDGNLGGPISASLKGKEGTNEKSDVILEIPQAIKGKLYTLRVSGLKDSKGVKMQGEIAATFSGKAISKTAPPVLLSIKSTGNTACEVVFDAPVNISNASFSIKEKTGEKQNLLIKSKSLTADGKKVILETEPQKATGSYELVIAGITSTLGQKVDEIKSPFTGTGPAPVIDNIPPKLLSALADSNTSVKLLFDKEVKLDQALFSACSSTNAQDILEINAATVSSDGKTVLLMTKSQKASILYRVGVINIANGNGIVASELTAVFAGMAGNTQPVGDAAVKLTSARAISGTSVEAVFDSVVRLQDMTIVIVEKYGARQSLAIQQTSLSQDGKTVTLTTASQKAATLYDLIVSGLKTAQGLPAYDQKLAFGGIMDPQVPLPEAAVKLISARATGNTSVEAVFDSPISLDGLTFTASAMYGSKQALQVSQVSLGQDGKTVSIVTGPQTGVVLYSLKVFGLKSSDGSPASEQKAPFAGIGAVLPPPPANIDPAVKIASVRALSNISVEAVFDGEVNSSEITITIDRLTISNTTFSNDGRSVIIDTAPQTAGRLYSLRVSGLKTADGQPASDQTHVFAGMGVSVPTPPVLQGAIAINSTTVKAYFNMIVDISQAQFAITETGGERNTVQVISASSGPENGTILIATDNLKAGSVYELKIRGIRSASGLEAQEMTFTFAGVS